MKKGLYKKVYSAEFAQANYKKNRKRSVKKLILTENMKERILHYHQKFSPEMMVKTKDIKAGVTTIYYWINNGHLGLTKEEMLYPRRRKASRKQTSSIFKPAGKSIDERTSEINLRMENGH